MTSVSSKIKLLSTQVELLTKQDLIELVLLGMVKRQVIVAHHNLHSAALLRKSVQLSSFFLSVTHCYIDGMPIVWLARFCGFPARREHRNTQLDWVSDLLRATAAAGKKVFYVGGTEPIAAMVQTYLEQAYPNLKIKVHHGYLQPEQDALLHAQINGFDPDLIIFGMGMPRQELWLFNNHSHIRFGVALTSGAALEYFAGVQKSPSRLSGRLGLEWLVRLRNEPRRLGHRYLIETWSLVLPAARDVLHYRFGSGRSAAKHFRALQAGESQGAAE